MDEVYNNIRPDLKTPDDGVQLVKTVGNINPDEITKHMNEAKTLYDNQDKGPTKGTTVQCVSVSRPNKEGKKEPVQYIKATCGDKKPGVEPVSYYKVKGGTDARDILDQIQEKGKPDGVDGKDYEKVKPDELPEVQKLFDGSGDIPKTFYYTTNVKGSGKDKNGKPYTDGKVHSVTVLNDPKNRTNKNHQVLQVFRKAEEANNKKLKDDNKYYYTKTLGSKLNKDGLPEVTNVPKDTDMKDIYNKVKGDMSNRPGDENDDLVLIKVPPNKDVNDVLQKLKSKGDLTPKPKGERVKKESPKEDEEPITTVEYVKVDGDDKNKPGIDREPEQYIKVSGPLLNKPKGGNEPEQYFKVIGDGNVKDIVDQIKAKGSDWNTPDNQDKLQKVEGKDLDDVKDLFKKEDEKPAEYYYKTRLVGDKDKKGDNLGKIKSIIIKGDTENKLNEGKKIGDVFGKEKEKPKYYYCKVLGAGKNQPENIQLIPAEGDDNMDDVYDKIKTLGGISYNPKDDEGVQLIKVYGDAGKNDIEKHIKEAENNDNKSAPKDKPEQYYFQNRILGDNLDKPGEPKILGKVESVTIKRDPDNNLNKHKKIDDVFNDEEGDDDKGAKYYGCKVGGGDAFKNPDFSKLQLISVSDRNGVKDVYDYLKQNGGLSDKGDGIQLFKVTGNVDNNKISKHLQDSRKNAPNEGDDKPAEFYYETKVLGDGMGEDKAADARGVVKSVTIKRDPNNDLNKDKDVKQLFKEADKNDKDGDDELEDENPAYYYCAKVNGDGRNAKPEDLNIEQITPDTKIEDVYNKMRLKGDVMKKPEDDDGIQIFKVVGDVDNNDIVEHIKHAGDNRNNKPGENGKLRSGLKPADKKGDKKGDEPILDYGQYKIYGDDTGRAGRKPRKDDEDEDVEDGNCIATKVLGDGTERIDTGDKD